MCTGTVQFTQAGPDSRWCIGHVRQGLDQAKREQLRGESQAEKTPCRDCAIRDRCQNTCGCLNWQLTGQVSRVGGILCAHERMLIPIADEIGL